MPIGRARTRCKSSTARRQHYWPINDAHGSDGQAARNSEGSHAACDACWRPLESPTPSHALALEALNAAGKKLGVELQMVPVRTVEEFDPAFATMTEGRVDCFLVVPSAFSYSYRTQLADLALKHRLGNISAEGECGGGGLMSYGADTRDLYRRAAYYVDRILKGAKPPICRSSSQPSSS